MPLVQLKYRKSSKCAESINEPYWIIAGPVGFIISKAVKLVILLEMILYFWFVVTTETKFPVPSSITSKGDEIFQLHISTVCKIPSGGFQFSSVRKIKPTEGDKLV
jgi:hypothetical protein